ncbi:MAG: YncE family protein [Paludibacter sp.]|nr:YncE family protein [Paludibacter sp.]
MNRIKGYMISAKMIKYFLHISILTLIILIVSCDDMHDKQRTGNEMPVTEGTRIFVLSEGLINLNNSSLAMYDFSIGAKSSDYFLTANKRGLGDTANDMGLYGSKLYVVVNVSSQIEVLDAGTGLSLKQIPLFNGQGMARQPRYIDFHGGKAYVCSFDGTLAKIDTTTLQVEKLVNCGRNPDGICITNGKIYVSNSGGLNFPNYDNTVSVIDITSFQEIKKTIVGINPYKIASDSEGDVYVVTRGNYGNTAFQFHRISSETDEVVQDFDDFHLLNFTIQNDTAYMYHYDYNTGQNQIMTFDCKTETLTTDRFIADGTILTTPFGIDVNPINGDVYITDAKSYLTWGDVLCFNRKGQLKFRIKEVGLNPNKVVAVRSY